MTKTRALAIGYGAGAAIAVVGCQSLDDSGPVQVTNGADAAATGDAAVADVGQPEGGGANEAGPDAPPPSAYGYIRAANWLPAAPALDFCVAAHGASTFSGPLLAAQGSALPPLTIPDAGDAAPATSTYASASGIVFPNVSEYVAVPVGSYDVRFVSSGADCTSGFGSDATAVPALAAGSYVTVAAVGSPAAPNTSQPLAWVDDSMAPGDGPGDQASMFAVRFIHASPEAPVVDVGSGTLAAGTFHLLLSAVSFGGTAIAAAADAGTLDSNGYLIMVGGNTGLAISAHPHAASSNDAGALTSGGDAGDAGAAGDGGDGGTAGDGGGKDTVSASAFVPLSGTIATIAMLAAPDGGAPSLLLCNDREAPLGDLAVCRIISH